MQRKKNLHTLPYRKRVIFFTNANSIEIIIMNLGKSVGFKGTANDDNRNR